MILQPETVIGWQRTGFRLFWRWKSRHRMGRPGKDRELIQLIGRMWSANPTWGSPRIRDELAKLGLQASTATIRKYRPKSRRRPSQSWWTFLRNHAGTMAGMNYHEVCSQRSLAHDSPIPRPVQLPDTGKVIEIPMVGGLHHQCLRQAA